MRFYRLIKSAWAKPTLANGETNPDFIEEINGPDVIEGYDYSQEFLNEKNQQGYNLYFFPNHPSKNVYADGVKHLSGKHIDTFNFVFVDMDLKDNIYKSKEEFIQKLKDFPLKPTMVVNSGNGIHAYWRISDLTRDSYVIAQLALINYFKTDESVFTVLQLMRLPGYLNTKKHKNYVPAAIVEEVSSGTTYTYDQLPKEIFSLSEETILRGQNHLAKLDGKITVQLPSFVNLDEIPDKFLFFIDDPKNEVVKKLFNDPKGFDGDRSRADMRLANILNKAGFNRKEALAVLSNTEKAISRGPHRTYYANLTISKVYDQELDKKFKSVGDTLRSDSNNERRLGAPVRGTWYFDYDVLGEPWRKKEVLGLIAGTGVGKTTVTLKWIKDSIENNPDNDDVFIFFSLEMPEAEIVKKWIALVGVNSKLADHLYVVGNEDEKGDPRNIGLQEVVEISQDIKKLTGKNIGIVAIDHIGLLARHIDTRKKYTFAIHSEPGAGWSDIRMLSLNTVATQMKSLAKLLDTFLIVLTQTTKGKGAGDLPIDKDGAYGISQYENIMDRIITIWQPLMYVQNQCKHYFLAWQYVKIRSKSNADRIKCYEPKLLTYVMDTGDLRVTTPDEYLEFQRLLPLAVEARENREKKKANGYSIHLISRDSLNEVKNLLDSKLKGEVKDVSKVQSH